jgi:hypothetical protein
MAAVHQSMQQGIQAIQAGNLAEGERLLRYALKDPALRGRLRATALNWLGEIVTNRDEKIRCFEEALDADPNNDYAEERLAELLRPPKPKPSVPPPPDTLPGDTGRTVPPPDTLPGQASALIAPPPPAPVYVPPGTNRPAYTQAVPTTPPQAPLTVRDYYVVGIIDSPNGRGSGFFLTNAGILATTRYVVGSRETVMVEFEPGHQQVAQVIRSFPDMDVALLKVDQPVRDLLPASPFDDIPDNTPITIMSYRQDKFAGRKRETGRTLAPHLFPTDILQVPDAGGGPVLNDRQYVVGMITRNISSSSAYVYGVHIAAVRRCLDIYNYEVRSVQNRVYCTSCGYASAAATGGGYYCESCGTVMPHARNLTRAQTPSMASLYGENTQPPCTQCGARAGFYNGLCLRCGLAGDPR